MLFSFSFLKSFFGQGLELGDSWADSRQVGCEYKFKAIEAEAERVANHSCGPNPLLPPPHACRSIAGI